jgi:predicted alpha/beta-fold hydrolase
MRRKNLTHPGRFEMDRLAGVWTVRQFDEAYTAPFFGFADATDYYHRASALRVIDRITVPALIITAEDDPFVPVSPFRSPALTGNPHITLVVTRHGGHCAFIGPPSAGSDGYWAEEQIVAFALHSCRE